MKQLTLAVTETYCTSAERHQQTIATCLLWLQTYRKTAVRDGGDLKEQLEMMTI
jgi:hypothetical protein